MTDKDFLTTKFAITNKVAGLFNHALLRIEQEIEANPFLLKNTWTEQSPKISKGENYRLLPYIILDYPRRFSKVEVFAFRTMFWWGNFFSCTLHLQGDALNQYIENIDKHFHNAYHDIFICVNHTPWEYHYERDNYMPANELTRQDFANVLGKSFLKISRKTDIGNWAGIPDFTVESFRMFLDLIR